MDEFIERWKTDSRFKAGVKLALYFLFVIIVTIYALSTKGVNTDIKNVPTADGNTINMVENTHIIEIPENYKYLVNITIDEKEYKYTGEVNNNEKTIIKTIGDTNTEYLYKENEYYIKDNDNYIKTNKDEVYDIISYNYIDLATINTYLDKATQSGNQYLVYLKDIILGDDSEKYFVILINDNNISIDYTPLMKTFNNSITNYKVKINIERI